MNEWLSDVVGDGGHRGKGDGGGRSQTCREGASGKRPQCQPQRRPMAFQVEDTARAKSQGQEAWLTAVAAANLIPHGLWLPSSTLA